MLSITGLSSINLHLHRKQFKMASLNLLLGSLILAGFNLDLTSSMEQTSRDAVTQLYAQGELRNGFFCLLRFVYF